MIASIKGLVVDIDRDRLILEVGGVGLQVNVPSPVLDTVRVGESLHLYSCLIVRQDSLTLYGFPNRDERELFNLLLEVNGIGPRLALATLSVLSPDAIRRAILLEQVDIFSRVPGVGKKTAQKILLQLQDRIPAISGLERVTPMSDLDGEVISALTGLGYSVVEAQSALQSIPKDTPHELEARLRAALQYFM